jgi:hypothetical protein
VTDGIEGETTPSPAEPQLPPLAFVSEPDIDLHIRPQASPVAPSSAAVADSSVVKLPIAEQPPASSPPPVRLMAQPPPSVDAEGATSAPVEVWASTHAPSALRGQVASFVGQNASFGPKSFGELLDASLQLGES